MINLEGIAKKLTHKLYQDTDMDTVEKAKIEYGFSITLGILIELSLALLLSALMGTVSYTLVLMFSALVLRMNSGGAHCTSYDRCLVFTLLVFVPISLVVKYIAVNQTPDTLLILSATLLAVISFYMLFHSKKAAIFLTLYTVIASSFTLLLVSNLWPRLLLASAIGLVLQGFMLTKLGNFLVNCADWVMEKLRI